MAQQTRLSFDYINREGELHHFVIEPEPGCLSWLGMLPIPAWYHGREEGWYISGSRCSRDGVATFYARRSFLLRNMSNITEEEVPKNG